MFVVQLNKQILIKHDMNSLRKKTREKEELEYIVLDFCGEYCSSIANKLFPVSIIPYQI